MTSGPEYENQQPQSLDDGDHHFLQWYEDSYGTSSVASLVVNGDERVIFYNDSVRSLLDLEAIDNLDDLGISPGIEESQGLGDAIRLAQKMRSPLSIWQGQLNTPTLHPLEVRFTPLPTPAASPHLLCQFVPLTQLEGEVRTRLISDLARVYHHQEGLDDCGTRLVDIIHTHLKAPVIVVWREEEGDETLYTWRAGSEKICDYMATAAGKNEPNDSGHVVYSEEDSPSTITIALDIGASTSAKIMIATRAGPRQLSASNPFWNCLAATSEAVLQSAHLWDRHHQDRLRLQAVIEQMPMAVVLFDIRGEILDLNLRARTMVGRRSWTKLGTEDHPFQVCDTEGSPLPREQWPMLRAVRTGQGCEEEEFILDFGDSKRTISITITPIVKPDGRVTSYLATGRDVTRRSKENRRKDEFLSVASHELRSPLTPLSGFLHLSRKQAESGETVDPDLLRRAEDQVRRLQRLIESLLDVSRLETGKLPIARKHIVMNNLVNKVMAPWLDGPHGERIELTLPDDPVKVFVDPDRIDQVLTNVVDNAIKHGRCDGRVRVWLEAEEDRIILTVADDGDGIPQQVIDRVFDRYFFQDSSVGTGLGLYISRQVIADHGGSITINSGRGEPTTVTITLPTE